MVGLIGIAVVDIAIADTQEVNLTGMYELPMNGAIPTEGTALYWDVANTRCDTVATVGQFIGNVGSTVAGASGFVRCILPGTGHPTSQALTQTPAIAQIATADATDLASAEALANACKAKINTILTQLHNAGVIA